MLATASIGLALFVPVAIAWRTELPFASLLRLPAGAHVAALLVLALEVGARGLRLVAIARGLKLPLSARTAWLAQLCADAAGAVTPSRSGSEPAKLMAMRRDGAPLAGVGAVAAVEMIFEVGGLLMIAALLALFAPGGRLAAAAILAYAGVVSMALTALFFIARRPDPDRAPRLWLHLKLTAERWRLLASTARDFSQQMRALRHLGAKAGLIAAGMTLTHQVARAATFPALVLGTAGVAAPLDWARLVIAPFSLLYLGALLPPPGGGGGVELGFAAALGDTLPAPQLPMLLLWWRAYTHYISAAIGAVLMSLLAARRAARRG